MKTKTLGKDFDELLSIIKKILSDEDGCIISNKDTFETQLEQIREEICELEVAINKDDKGEIVEMGNHQDLLDRKGRYYDLYLLQYQEEWNC